MTATDGLADFLPADAWTTAPTERAARARDWWPISAVRARRGAPPPPPSVVILPRSTDEVAAALRWASATGTPVVPRGGGSGVCGGVLVEDAGWAVLDLSEMDKVLDLDAESQVVRVQAGIRGGRLEAAVYAATWQRAIDACLAAGATITHHHGMGRLRADRAADELGVGGLAVMRRLKAALDPAGVLNPGALIR